MGESIFGCNLGGTIQATSNSIQVHSSVLITDNTAVDDGGLCLIGTNIKVFGTCIISHYQAKNGGFC